MSVSQLTRLLKSQIESSFPSVAIEGELSNVRPSSTGHIYLTLKDEAAQISGVIFKGRASRLTFTPEDGQQVVVYGSLGVYERRGTYQIIIERVELAGVGRILAMLEERKQKLNAEGLFANERKRRLPLLPARVAIVTSPTGAALRDILRVLRRRNSGINVVVCPAVVQGESAAESIAKQIRTASQLGLGDVIIVGRGGGSLEDLLPFSDEAVVRAIADAEIPIVSAVGHEIDWALSDYAADVRAPTPSAAAEIVAASRDELQRSVIETGRRIVSGFMDRLERMRLLVGQFSAEELHRSYWMLAQPTVQEFDRIRDDLVGAMRDRVGEMRARVDGVSRELASVSPYTILKRGYSIVRDEQGVVVASKDQIDAGDNITAQLANGTISATVTGERGTENEDL